MDFHRFFLQFSVVISAIALTAALMWRPGDIPNEVLEIIKQSLSVLWTLVAFIVRDVRNRDTGLPEKHKPDG